MNIDMYYVYQIMRGHVVTVYINTKERMKAVQKSMHLVNKQQQKLKELNNERINANNNVRVTRI